MANQEGTLLRKQHHGQLIFLLALVNVKLLVVYCNVVISIRILCCFMTTKFDHPVYLISVPKVKDET